VYGPALLAPLIRFHDIFQDLHDKNAFLFYSETRPEPRRDREAWAAIRRQVRELKAALAAVDKACAAVERFRVSRPPQLGALRRERSGTPKIARSAAAASAETDARDPSPRNLIQRLRAGFYQPSLDRFSAYDARRLVRRTLTDKVPERILISHDAFYGGTPSSKFGGRCRQYGAGRTFATGCGRCLH
jgi:hypothetical protein